VSLQRSKLSKCEFRLNCSSGPPREPVILQVPLLISVINGLKAVFQCLYAQCDTAHFGTALHYAISRCSETGIELHQIRTLHTITRKELRRREENYAAGLDKLYGSSSAGGFQTQTSGGLLTRDREILPTGSIDDIYLEPSTISAELTPSSIENIMSKTLPTASPLVSRATSVYPSSTATHVPKLYTGTGLKIDPYIIVAILIPITTLYLVL
jgi:hypothetical protein